MLPEDVKRARCEDDEEAVVIRAKQAKYQIAKSSNQALEEEQTQEAVYVNRLPEELLTEIFSYLDHKQLLQCMVTCRQWESVIHGNSGVWRHLELSGTLKEVDAKYTKMLKLAGGATFQTLSLGLVDWHGEGEEPLCWSETEICKRFPSGTLKSFQYASLWKKENDSKVWKSLSACKKLQKLDWEILNYSPQTYHVEGTSLAHCRLKMLTLKVTPGSDIDNDFVNLVSQANSMILHGLRKDMLWDIVNAAKENVESLECYDAYHWVTSAKPPIVMKKLKTHFR
jgi:hypothetical protein